ncbi:MAG: hypothetical protein ACJAXQ_001492 [Parvibaculaceae bacterium]|jgi:hypothetical protein
MTFFDFRAVLLVGGFLGAGLMFGFFTGAAADEVSSSYSSLDLDTCETIEQEPEFGTTTWRCEGQAGYTVYPTEADLRFYLAFGKGKAMATTGGATVPPFNHLGGMLEWRVENLKGAWTPFATIVRYHYSGGAEEPKGQVLVVSKFDDGETCTVGYVNALAEKNANSLARRLADDVARTFVCSRDQAHYVGKGASELW